MKKWLKRLALGFATLLALLILFLAGSILYDAIFGQSSAEFTNVTYSDNAGNTLRGYLALPEGPGPHPAILLIHEWWGHNHGMTVLADALAREGYVVLAADGYRGKLTAQVPRALWLRLTTPNEQVESDLDAALAYLRGLESVDTNHVASMGFCFGGGHSLQLGLRQSEILAVTVMYYGAVVTNPDLLRPFTDGQAVLGVFAEEDQTIFPAEVLEFEAALNSLDIQNQITIYPGVGHGFLNEDNYNQSGTAGDAWQETIAFLEQNLKAGGR